MPTPLPDSPSGSELIFAVVAAVGTDQDSLCQSLTTELAQLDYSAETIQLSRLLDDLPGYAEKLVFKSEGERYAQYMEAGTCLREGTGRGDALAMLAIMAIRDRRNAATGDPTKSLPRSAFILRSLKHPREVDTLRQVYGSNFVLISAYTAAEKRFQTLAKKLSASRHQFQGRDSFPEAQTLLSRDDAESDRELGQQVRKAFPLGDVFIDTSDSAQVPESVRRFMESLFGYPFHTPTRDEYGMFHAQAAGYRSAALGRQVGAAIATPEGDIIVVGTNEVPKAGGGLYWPKDPSDRRDFVTGSDINDDLKRRLLADVLARLQEAGWLNDQFRGQSIGELLAQINADCKSPLNHAQILNVIEYGRCVHAEMSVPLLATWYATGNNATLAGDISRRILHILLRSPLESPEERSDFVHADLRVWVMENRPRLLGAALTILSGYIQAGLPASNLNAFGSFEGWNKVVRGAVVWAGQHDPAITRSALRENADSERATFRCILENWSKIDTDGTGLTVGEFVDALQDVKNLKALAEVRDAVQSLVPDYDTRKIGAKFKKWRDRIIRQLSLKQGDIADGYRRWKVS